MLSEQTRKLYCGNKDRRENGETDVLTERSLRTCLVELCDVRIVYDVRIECLHCAAEATQKA